MSRRSPSGFAWAFLLFAASLSAASLFVWAGPLLLGAAAFVLAAIGDEFFEDSAQMRTLCNCHEPAR